MCMCVCVHEHVHVKRACKPSSSASKMSRSSNAWSLAGGTCRRFVMYFRTSNFDVVTCTEAEKVVNELGLWL